MLENLTEGARMNRLPDIVLASTRVNIVWQMRARVSFSRPIWLHNLGVYETHIVFATLVSE